MAFKEKFKEYVEKGVEVSKEAFSKAGAAVSKFGDESVVRIEKHQYENQLKEELQKLGEIVFSMCGTDVSSFDAQNPDFLATVEKIKNVKAEIRDREESLKKDKKEDKEEKEEKKE